jgi:RNA polymerase sigma-70 factor (ECF subfamily)
MLDVSSNPEPLPALASAHARFYVGHVARVHGDALHRFALRLTRNPSDASDLVQSALERALSRPQSIHSERELLGWLRVVMRNLVIDQQRAQRRQRVLPLDESLARTLVQVDQTATDCERNVAELWDAIEQLTPCLREAIEGRLKGWSITRIARDTQTPLPTVGTRVFRARQRLRELLGDSACALVEATD